MPVEILTKADLHQFKVELLAAMEMMLARQPQPVADDIAGYPTKRVRQVLGCSANKLQSLRIHGLLRRKKVGGTYYYNKEDLHKLLNDGYR